MTFVDVVVIVVVVGGGGGGGAAAAAAVVVVGGGGVFLSHERKRGIIIFCWRVCLHVSVRPSVRSLCCFIFWRKRG
jgi:hypothetical protein